MTRREFWTATIAVLLMVALIVCYLHVRDERMPVFKLWGGTPVCIPTAADPLAPCPWLPEAVHTALLPLVRVELRVRRVPILPFLDPRYETPPKLLAEPSDDAEGSASEP